MAIRRMFAKSITDSDDFLDLPLDVQLLYFHLGMQADDEGFLNSTRKIVRMLGVEPDALQILCGMRSMNGRKPVSEQRKPTLEKREPLTNHVLDKRVRRKGEGRIG